MPVKKFHSLSDCLAEITTCKRKSASRFNGKHETRPAEKHIFIIGEVCGRQNLQNGKKKKKKKKPMTPVSGLDGMQDSGLNGREMMPAQKEKLSLSDCYAEDKADVCLIDTPRSG
jgi:hypothetical protein